MPTDSELIDQFRRGNAEAMQTLVERHQSTALRHALLLLKNLEEARDAVQDAFIDVVRVVDSYNSEHAFYAWYYVLLRNRCLKSLRAKGRRDAAHASLAERVRLLQASDCNDAIEHLEESMQAMTAEDRELIGLRHFDGLSYAELARRLSIPEGTVMSRLFHARKRLRDIMTRDESPSEDLRP